LISLVPNLVQRLREGNVSRELAILSVPRASKSKSASNRCILSDKLQARGATVAEWVVMREMYDDEETSPSLLAERIGMTRGGVSKLVDRLVA